jgi:SAM-dependent methyltransferase
MRRCVGCAATLNGAGWACRSCGLTPPTVDGIAVLAPELAGGNPADATYLCETLHTAAGRHFWFTSRSRLIAWAIERYFPDVQSLFDAGCGTGDVVTALRTRLPRVHVVAGDALLSALAVARRQSPDVAFVQIDLRRLPYDREFDVGGMFDVLEHLDDDEQVLREMFRATRPGGGLIVTVPQHRFLWSALDDYSHHRRRYGRRELIGKISRAGYVVQRATSFMSVTLPLQVASRLRQQDVVTLDPAAEMRLNPAINGVLRALCRVERTMIASGLSLPIGGSLLVVARRPS